MAVDFDAEVLAEAFDAFARPVTLIDGDGVASAARGILSRKPHIADMGQGAFAAEVLTLGLRVSELAARPVEGWQVVIGSATYRIPQPPAMDGEGRIEVMLQAI